MNLIKIKSLVINLDNVTYWQTVPTSQRNRPTPKGGPPSDPNAPKVLYEDSDDPTVVIHFVSEDAKLPQPLILGMPMSRAFLAHLQNKGLIDEVQAEQPSGSEGGPGAAPASSP